MKTAIEFLVEELQDYGFKHLDLAIDIIEEAKQKEREQIESAFSEGVKDSGDFCEVIYEDGKDYYETTFKK